GRVIPSVGGLLELAAVVVRERGGDPVLDDRRQIPGLRVVVHRGGYPGRGPGVIDVAVVVVEVGDGIPGRVGDGLRQAVLGVVIDRLGRPVRVGGGRVVDLPR